MPHPGPIRFQHVQGVHRPQPVLETADPDHQTGQLVRGAHASRSIPATAAQP